MQKSKPSLFYDIYNQPHDVNTRLKLYNSTKSSLQLIQRINLLKRLKVHYGCVNSICWNHTGDIILSGSDDQHLVLTNVFNYQVMTNYKTSHKANIFSAKFLPHNGDHRIVSCSGDGIILYTDLMRKVGTIHNQFNCHSGTTYEIATVPYEPHSFLSCGEDGTVRWFDLRIKEKCNISKCKEDILISCQRPTTAISVNPVLSHQIVVGCSDSTVKTFDRRMLGTKASGWKDEEVNVKPIHSFTVPEFEGNSYRITSLSYSPDGQDILVSYSSDHLYLFSMKKFEGSQLKQESVITKSSTKKYPLRSPQQVRRLRLRGDWSDTGPDARPEREGGRQGGQEIAQARPVLHTSLMQRMTDVLSRMLNDPATRAALSGGGEDSLEGVIDHHGDGNVQNNIGDSGSIETNEERNSIIDDRQQSLINLSNSTDVDNSAIEVENNQMIMDEFAEEPIGRRENSFVNENSEAVPMEVESSELSRRLEISTANPDVFHTLNSQLEGSSEISSANVENNSIMENLQDRLTTMRDGFLERHGSEPAIKLTYSDRSSTRATISLGVADEVTRENYHPDAAAAENSLDNISNPGPSSSRQELTTHETIQEGTSEDLYNDSDEENTDSSRLPEKDSTNCIEAEMEEAIRNARAAHGLEDDCSLSDIRVKQKYMGHRNARAQNPGGFGFNTTAGNPAGNPAGFQRQGCLRTMIKEANFWGDNFVMSGSDCGHVFIWDRQTGKLCMLLEADQHVVNCVQPHPFLPMLATSGIDYDVKLWEPMNENSSFDEKFAEDLMKRNAVMLEETKDTITVPAVFMIRMLACLNQIRRGGARSRNRRRNEEEE